MFLMSVIIPCYNELDSIDVLYRKSLYITKNYDVEIIFVDNGSSDGSSKKFKSLISTKKIKFSSIKTNKGYGYGIKKSIDLTKKILGLNPHIVIEPNSFQIDKTFTDKLSQDFKEISFSKSYTGEGIIISEKN